MTFSFSGKKIFYDVVGKGSPLLLVHGWGGSSESLRKLGELLSDKHKIIIVDLPGFGNSETPPPDWGTKEYADVLVGLFDELKIKKTDYFGHSFGGALGIYIAANTNRIDNLILCNSSYRRSQKRSPLVRLAHHLLPGNNSPLKIMLYRIFFRNSDLARYPHLEQTFRRIMKEDLSPFVEKVSAPTLILWGAKDTITPVALAHDLHERIKDSELVIFPDARHALPLRNPELLINSINSFL